MPSLLNKIRDVLPRTRFFGRVEGIQDGRICGWVVDGRHARIRVPVEFLRDSVVTHAVRADVYRADVQKAGLSEDGYCGFRVPVHSIAGQGRLCVKLSPKHEVVGVEESVLSPPSVVQQGSNVYSATRMDGHVVGFAVDLDDPTNRKRVTLFETGGARSRHVACRYESRAPNLGDHDRFIGFRIPYSQSAARLEDTESGFVIASWPT